MLTIHLSHHTGEKEDILECHEKHLTEHIAWNKNFAIQVVKKALSTEMITSKKGLLGLTHKGMEHVVAAMRS